MFQGLPDNVPGLVRPDGGRNRYRIRKRRMPADPAADLGRVVAAALVEAAVLIAARGPGGVGVGVTQRNQPAHGVNLDSLLVPRFRSSLFVAAPSNTNFGNKRGTS